VPEIADSLPGKISHSPLSGESSKQYYMAHTHVNLSEYTLKMCESENTLDLSENLSQSDLGRLHFFLKRLIVYLNVANFIEIQIGCSNILWLERKK
jgi:hypothetical protein